MSALSSFWGNRSKKQKIAIVVVLVLVIFGTIGSFNKPKTNLPASDAKQIAPTSSPAQNEVSIEDLKASYLADLDNVEMDYFVADKAAFGYLKSYCQNIEDGMMPATPDAIAKVVASYCGTRLAEDLGVVEARPFPAGVDTEEFNETAKKKWGFGDVTSDGSYMVPARYAMKLCYSDVDTLVENQGTNFKGSFYEYALKTFCPEALQ